MQILLVTHYYSTHRGGIEIVAARLGGLLGQAHEVIWAASDCDPIPDCAVPSLRFAPMRSTNVLERLTGLPFPIWGPRSLARLWREVRAADVIHLHDSAYFGNWAAFVFARLRRKPVLVTQHVGFIPYRSLILRGALGALHATIGRLVLGRADQVVFISKVVREYFAGFVRFRRPPLLVANGVDGSVFVPRAAGERERTRAALGLEPSKPVLLFVGRFVEKKGLHILEALSRRVPEASWVFAGWGPVDPRRWNAPNVTVFENRRGAELVPLYHAADFLVLPSVGEGLPLVVQEAMSCGTPVLIGEDTAVAVDAPLGLVFACKVEGQGTVDEWEFAIHRLLNDTRDRPQLERAVAEFARGKWSWTASAATYSCVLERMTTASGERKPWSSTRDEQKAQKERGKDGLRSQDDGSHPNDHAPNSH